jgi:hypothetical protein
LSLIGGWRQGKTTVLHWQMNAAGYGKNSIGTAMRAFFLEDEIARGNEFLLIHGGTGHSMRRAFSRHTVADLIVRRKSMRSVLLRWCSRLFATPNRLLGRVNFLATVLCDPQLQWREGQRQPKKTRPVLGKRPVLGETAPSGRTA